MITNFISSRQMIIQISSGVFMFTELIYKYIQLISEYFLGWLVLHKFPIATVGQETLFSWFIREALRLKKYVPPSTLKIYFCFLGSWDQNRDFSAKRRENSTVSDLNSFWGKKFIWQFVDYQEHFGFMGSKTSNSNKYLNDSSYLTL